MTHTADNITPFYSGQRVIDPRHPLFPPVTVVSVYEIEPRVWRFDWECRIAPDLTPVTGSAQAASYVRAGGG